MLLRADVNVVVVVSALVGLPDALEPQPVVSECVQAAAAGFCDGAGRCFAAAIRHAAAMRSPTGESSLPPLAAITEDVDEFLG